MENDYVKKPNDFDKENEKLKEAMINKIEFENTRKYLFLYNYLFVMCLLMIDINKYQFFIANIIIYTFYLAMDYEHVRHVELTEKETYLGMNYLAHINSKDKKNILIK